MSGISIADLTRWRCVRPPGEYSMSIYDRPFDPDSPLKRSGCICGHHRSPEEHEYDARRTMICEPAAAPSEER